MSSFLRVFTLPPRARTPLAWLARMPRSLWRLFVRNLLLLQLLVTIALLVYVTRKESFSLDLEWPEWTVKVDGSFLHHSTRKWPQTTFLTFQGPRSLRCCVHRHEERGASCQQARAVRRHPVHIMEARSKEIIVPLLHPKAQLCSQVEAHAARPRRRPPQQPS